MSNGQELRSVAAVSTDVGDAVGVNTRRWFVAVVKNNTEKVVEERLSRMGFDTYVAKQTVFKIWKNGKKARVDKVLLPSLVFIKCSEHERKELVALPYINRFMTNKAGNVGGSGSKPLAVIPQQQIDLLKFMLGQSDIPVTLIEAPFKVHDRVVVLRGSLRGLEGEVLETIEGRSELIVRVDILGCARMVIDSTEIELIK